ncbi:MAG: hypothetical protein NC489_17440 [Ruminococcus flavefaciens]|nr:hypothetical protein [Ruminococcus flavefaciens]
MENEFLRIFNGFKSCVDPGMRADLKAFLEVKEIEKYDVQIDENGVILILMKLTHYSHQDAKNMFMSFVSFIGYEGMNMFYSVYSDHQAEHLFFTAFDDQSGVKMKVRMI